MSDIGISAGILRNKKILDYGCANGVFLDFCALNGCFKKDLLGFDIAKDLLKEIIEKQYNTLNDDCLNFFDYIFLWDVIEHHSKPKELLKIIKLYLKRPGGVIVETPRVGIISDTLKDKWEHFLLFEHVILYTRKALVKLSSNAGFRLLKISSFGANAPLNVIPQHYKNAFDNLAKQTDNGSTQVAYFVSNC